MGLEQVLARLVEGARQVTQADAVEVRLLDEEGARLEVAAASDPSGARGPRESIEVARSPLDREALSGGEALSGQPVIITDTQTDPRAASVPGDYRSLLCVPLMHEPAPLGTLHVYAAAPHRFGEAEAARLAALADLGAAAIAATRGLAALAALEASKSQFIRITTHELRSPVTIAQSLVRGVLKGYAGEMTDKQAEVFGRISRRLDLLESLVNDLLDLAAGKAPELGEKEVPVLLNASIGRAVLLLQPRAEEKGLEMTLHPCRDQLIVWGTEEGLDRVFVNLVSNAVKYTPSGGAITITVRRADERAQVEVADTGIGIPEESLPRLFEEFYRAPNAKALNEVGTGLGLAIVKDLVERFGGRIEVESTVGQGTTFAVAFPVHRFTE
jgi:signal transduction histidine kinase